MKIATLSPYCTPGRNAGSEVMLRWMADSLVKAGHEVIMVATDDEIFRGTETELDGVRIIFSSERQSESVIHDFNPDIIVSQQTRILNAAKLKRSTGAKLVAVIHSEHTMTSRWLGQRPDLTIFNTYWMWEKHSRPGGAEIVLHPPVWAREHQTTPGDCITLVNLNEAKGAFTFYELASDFPDRKFLGVVGGYGDQIIPSNLPPNVEIIPNTTDMRGDVWSRTNILLMPSEHESYGMAAVEALQSGIPVIASPTEGLAESLSYAGIFVPRNDIDGWVRAIKLVEEHYGHRSSLALERARELDPTIELSAWVDAIENLRS